jgi:hypothetical protein
MAKVTFTGGVQSIRGTIGNMVYKLWKTGVTTMQNKPTAVRNPGSARQGEVRELLANMAKRWLQNLNDTQRSAWETLASKGPYRTNREGGTRAVIRTNNNRYSGKNAYVIYNTLAASVGQTTPIDDPDLHNVAPLEPTAPAAAYAANKITVTWGDIPNVTADDYVRIWIASASGDFHKQFVGYALATAKTYDITAVRAGNGDSQLISKFAGSNVYVQLDTVRKTTGTASAPSSALVVAIA